MRRDSARLADTSGAAVEYAMSRTGNDFDSCDVIAIARRCTVSVHLDRFIEVDSHGRDRLNSSGATLRVALHDGGDALDSTLATARK